MVRCWMLSCQTSPGPWKPLAVSRSPLAGAEQLLPTAPAVLVKVLSWSTNGARVGRVSGDLSLSSDSRPEVCLFPALNEEAEMEKNRVLMGWN